MIVGFCQYDVRYKDIEQNLQVIETLLRDVKADIMVLPELALTGYYFEEKASLMSLSKEAINLNVIERLRKLADARKMTLVIGLSEIEEESLYNTVYVIDQRGVVGKHRKINLTNNETIFTRGETVEVINVNGIKLGIAICFETWFPEMFRLLVNKAADLIVCPSNFGGPWTLDVVKVRALENSIPVVLCNRLGAETIEGVLEYFRGESQIIDGYGNCLIKAGSENYVGTFELDLNAFSRNRSLISDCMVVEQARYKSK